MQSKWTTYTSNTTHTTYNQGTCSIELAHVDDHHVELIKTL